MKEYTVVNILDMLEAIGEENLSAILSDFSCPINKEIENFVWHNAIEFAKKKMSITYFLMDAEGEIAAIFTLTHKAVANWKCRYFFDDEKKTVQICTVGWKYKLLHSVRLFNRAVWEKLWI